MATREEYLKNRREQTDKVGLEIAVAYSKGKTAKEVAELYPNPLTGKPYKENYIYLLYKKFKHLL